ncbi:hypothetical protein NXY56_003001 [Leishmania guyanensis]
MRCVRRVAFIDRGDPGTLWSHDLKKQWYYSDLVAVRVDDSNEKVLGSTIPDVFTLASEAGHSTVCVSWINEDPVAKPMLPEKAPEEMPRAGRRWVTRGVRPQSTKAIRQTLRPSK